MKASELRIGNWVFSNLTRQNFTVTPEGIYYINSDESVSEPIPLTEEWLLRFGFEKLSDNSGRIGYKLIDNELVYTGMLIDNKITIVCKFLNSQLGLPILYVHQLQNLYFALTGQELELKEKVNA